MRNMFFVLLLLATTVSCSKTSSSDNISPDPSLSIGKFYVHQGGLTCYDLDSGRISWNVSGIGIDYPAYDSGRIYTSDPWEIRSVDALTGSTVWSTNLSNRGFNSNSGGRYCSPEVVGSFVYTTAWTGASGNTTVYALDKNSGKILWSKSLIDPLDDFQTSLPRLKVVNDRIVLSGYPFNDDNKMFVLNRFTGEILLSRSFHGPTLDDQIIPGYFVQADENYAYVQDRREPEIHAVDLITGDRKWTTTFEELQRDGERISMVKDRLVYTSGPIIYVLDKRTGEILNRITDGNYIMDFYASDSHIFFKTVHKIYSYLILGQTPVWQIDSPFGKEWDMDGPGTSYALSGNFILADDDLISCDDYKKTTFSIIDKNTGSIKKAISFERQYYGIGDTNPILVRGNRSFKTRSASN